MKQESLTRGIEFILGFIICIIIIIGMAILPSYDNLVSQQNVNSTIVCSVQQDVFYHWENRCEEIKVICVIGESSHAKNSTK